MAEEYPVGDVGVPVVAEPLVEVVRLGPGGRSVAAGPAAAAVAHRHSGALFLGEESFVPADVDALAVVVELDPAGAGRGVAEQPFDGLPGHRDRAALQPPVSGLPRSGLWPVRVFSVTITRTAGRRPPKTRPGSASPAILSSSTNESAAICSVVRGRGVVLHPLGPGGLLLVDEAHPAPAGPGDHVVGGEHELAVFGGEEAVQAHLPVAQPVDLQVAVVVGLLLPGGDAGLVELVAHPPGPLEHLVDVQRRRLREQHGQGFRELLGGDGGVDVAEAGADRLGRVHGQGSGGHGPGDRRLPRHQAEHGDRVTPGPPSGRVQRRRATSAARRACRRPRCRPSSFPRRPACRRRPSTNRSSSGSTPPATGTPAARPGRNGQAPGRERWAIVAAIHAATCRVRRTSLGDPPLPGQRLRIRQGRQVGARGPQYGDGIRRLPELLREVDHAPILPRIAHKCEKNSASVETDSNAYSQAGILDHRRLRATATMASTARFATAAEPTLAAAHSRISARRARVGPASRARTMAAATASTS